MRMNRFVTPSVAIALLIGAACGPKTPPATSAPPPAPTPAARPATPPPPRRRDARAGTRSPDRRSGDAASRGAPRLVRDELVVAAMRHRRLRPHRLRQ